MQLWEKLSQAFTNLAIRLAGTFKGCHWEAAPLIECEYIFKSAINKLAVAKTTKPTKIAPDKSPAAVNPSPVII